jgi:hypothetical protein
VIRNDAGATVSSASLTLPPMGHAAFVLTSQFVNTANSTGTIEFDTPSNGRIAVLGLRYPPGQRFTTIPVVASSDPGSGALAHLAAGSGWITTIELVNTGATSAAAQVKFFAEDGTPLALPLTVSGSSTALSTLSQTLAPHQHVVLQSASGAADALLVGSAQLTSNGSVSGFIRFRYDPWNQEAIVPLETTSNAAAHLLPFDNTAAGNSAVVGVAISNLLATTATIPVIVRDSVGNVLETGQITLTGNGHTSFVLSSSFIAAANQKGSIEFDTSTGGHLSVLGISFDSAQSFSTIPVTMR